MSGSGITAQDVRPEAVSTDTRALLGKHADDWQHFQLRSRQQIEEALERLYEALCLERYSLYDRERFHATLQDACSRFLTDAALSQSARLSLSVCIRTESVQATLELLDDVGEEPGSSCCEAGILLKGYQLRWAQYLKVGEHLQLIECRVLH